MSLVLLIASLSALALCSTVPILAFIRLTFMFGECCHVRCECIICAWHLKTLLKVTATGTLCSLLLANNERYNHFLLLAKHAAKLSCRLVQHKNT